MFLFLNQLCIVLKKPGVNGQKITIVAKLQHVQNSKANSVDCFGLWVSSGSAEVYHSRQGSGECYGAVSLASLLIV